MRDLFIVRDVGEIKRFRLLVQNLAVDERRFDERFVMEGMAVQDDNVGVFSNL